MAFNSDDLPDAPAVDNGSCKLLGTTALIVQALMGVVVISSLLYKRHRESIKRPWRVWLFDVSKQIIGQAFVHGVNVLLSDLGALALAGNACTYYFLNILIDTTLGVGILYAVLHLLTHLFSVTLYLKGFESGQYGRPPQWRNWARQLGVYVAALTTMKLAVIGLFFLFPGIFKLGEWALSWLGDSAHGQVIFTMGVFPILMNVLQFWLIDSIVKASTLPPSTPAPRSPSHEHEPLFQDPDSDDEDSRRPDDIEAQRSASSLASRSASRSPALGHAYPPHPPRLNTKSPTTMMRQTSTPSPPPSHHRQASTANARRKRSIPPPLMPRSPLVPAINSPAVDYFASKQDSREGEGVWFADGERTASVEGSWR